MSLAREQDDYVPWGQVKVELERGPSNVVVALRVVGDLLRCATVLRPHGVPGAKFRLSD
jgi:hypothetical protein